MPNSLDFFDYTFSYLLSTYHLHHVAFLSSVVQCTYGLLTVDALLMS